MTNRNRLAGIEALRGYAASAVLMLHAVRIHPVTLPESLSAFAAYCTYGVPLFFVISAFSLAYGYSGGNDEPGWKIRYAIRRFFRIAPLFYLMIAAWTLYILWLGGAAYTPIEYLLNVTFTFGLVPGYQNSIVPAGWSIGAEMIFYALLPLLLMFINSLPKAIFAFIVSLGLSYAFSKFAESIGLKYMLFYWANIFNNMPYFVFGMLSYHLFVRLAATGKLRQWSNLLLVAAIGVGVFNVATDTMPKTDFSTAPPTLMAVAGWAAAFGLLVTSQALSPNRFIVNRVMLFLGAISFSLYLIHPLVIYAPPVIPWIEAAPVAPLVKALLAWGFAFAVVTPLAWVTYRLIEVPGQAVGKLVAARRLAANGASTAVERFLAQGKKALRDQPKSSSP